MICFLTSTSSKVLDRSMYMFCELLDMACNSVERGGSCEEGPNWASGDSMRWDKKTGLGAASWSSDLWDGLL